MGEKLKNPSSMLGTSKTTQSNLMIISSYHALGNLPEFMPKAAYDLHLFPTSHLYPIPRLSNEQKPNSNKLCPGRPQKWGFTRCQRALRHPWCSQEPQKLRSVTVHPPPFSHPVLCLPAGLPSPEFPATGWEAIWLLGELIIYNEDNHPSRSSPPGTIKKDSIESQ